MCGIVGVIGRGPAAPRLVSALKRLEYRGYDSAGVATLEDGVLTRVRAEGKLKNLEAKLEHPALTGEIGIGHTRWATHGKPTENNAHPHASDRLAVVHNGIIENFRALREELAAKGHAFRTETDSEVAAFLVTDELERNKSPAEAVRTALKRMKGAFALVYLFKGETNLLIGARQGAPLAVGYGDGEMFLGSDALALAPFTDRVAYLEEGDWVVVTREGVEFRNLDNKLVRRRVIRSPAGGLLAEKGNYRHFMAKEIHEQPEVVGHTLAHYVDLGAQKLKPFAFPADPARISRVSIVACGTAYMAGLVGKYWIERFARLPVEVDVASEYRYREPPVEKDGLTIFISQSGETADTLASLRYAKEQGSKTLAIVNVATSSIARLSDARAPTLAGPGDRRRLDKSLHLPARGRRLSRDRARQGEGRARRGEGAGADRRADLHSRPHRGSAEARASARGHVAQSGEGARRALSRPRLRLSARARRGAEAQGAFLHPRRGLRGGRTEARPDRADRRGDARHRAGAARQRV